MPKDKNKKRAKIHRQGKLDSVAVHGVALAIMVLASLIVGSLLFVSAEKVKNTEYFTEFPSMFELKIRFMVIGTPMNEMVPMIAKEDGKAAAFLVAIAKKESNWGIFSPQKNGKTCYNYWGYRGTYNQTSSGYSCFDSPEQAVNVVSGRIEELIDRGIDTPGEMVVWKCGESCAGFSPESVNKWISDINYYFEKIM